MKLAKTKDKMTAPVMPEAFWEDWRLATGALRGRLKLTKVKREQWAAELKHGRDV